MGHKKLGVPSRRYTKEFKIEAVKLGHSVGMSEASRRDRGSQYASDDYRKVLKQFHMTQSMSRKGNCWDNAPMESFFRTLKVERTYRLRYTSRDQARLDIVNWIEGSSALGDRLSITRGLRTQPESCMSLMYVESRQGHLPFENDDVH